MPQIIPALLATGTAAAAVAMPVVQAKEQTKSLKSAMNQATEQNQAAIQEVKDAQANASNQATAAIETRRRRAQSGSQTIFTSPLGISGSAAVARKTLLGQ